MIFSPLFLASSQIDGVYVHSLLVDNYIFHERLALQACIIVVQAALQIIGFSGMRYANVHMTKSHMTSVVWWSGVGFYLLSLLVYLGLLAIAPLSWSVVVSCAVNLIFSCVSSFLLGEGFNQLDALRICLSIVCAALASAFPPAFDHDQLVQVLDSLFDNERQFLSTVGCAAVLLVVLMYGSRYVSRPLESQSLVLCYGVGTAFSQATMKLCCVAVQQCRSAELLSFDDQWECVREHRGRYAVLLTLLIGFGAVSSCTMLTGVHNFENRFWLPNAFAFEIVFSVCLGLLLFSEARYMDVKEVFAFCCSAAVGILGLTLSVRSEEEQPLLGAHAC